MHILVLMVCISFVLECVIALVWLAVKKVKEKFSYLTVYFMIPIIAITYAVFFGISILVLGKKLHGRGHEYGKDCNGSR